jgi:hypothetical protein
MTQGGESERQDLDVRCHSYRNQYGVGCLPSGSNADAHTETNPCATDGHTQAHGCATDGSAAYRDARVQAQDHRSHGRYLAAL